MFIYTKYVIHICIYSHKHIYIYTCIHIYIFINIHIYTHMNIYVYMYVYIYVNLFILHMLTRDICTNASCVNIHIGNAENTMFQNHVSDFNPNHRALFE